MNFLDFNDSTAKNKVMTVSEVFAKQLMQLSGVSPDKAVAILDKYPTPKSLLDAYKVQKSVEDQELLLSELKCGENQRTLGSSLSKLIYQLFCSPSLCWYLKRKLVSLSISSMCYLHKQVVQVGHTCMEIVTELFCLIYLSTVPYHLLLKVRSFGRIRMRISDLRRSLRANPFSDQWSIKSTLDKASSDHWSVWSEDRSSDHWSKAFLWAKDPKLIILPGEKSFCLIYK